MDKKEVPAWEHLLNLFAIGFGAVAIPILLLVLGLQVYRLLFQ